MTRGLVLIMTLLLAGCAESYTVFHSQTGNPIILGRRAYSYEGCLSTMREEAARLGVSLSTVQSERLLARSITPLALRARVCLRRGNRSRTSPTRNLSERSTTLTSRVVIVHFLLFLTSPSHTEESGRDFSFSSSRDLLTILPLAQYYSTNTTRCSLWVPTLGSTLRFSPTVIHRKEVDRCHLAALFVFAQAGNRKFQRQCGRSIVLACRTLFEIICFTRSCINGRPRYRRRRRLIRT